MGKENARISAKCRYFVCRECRTKVGWQHQRWCVTAGRTRCSCADCLYLSEKRGMCMHPILKREERIKHETIKYPV